MKLNCYQKLHFDFNSHIFLFFSLNIFLSSSNTTESFPEYIVIFCLIKQLAWKS